jgi:hypothetical protein
MKTKAGSAKNGAVPRDNQDENGASNRMRIAVGLCRREGGARPKAQPHGDAFFLKPSGDRGRSGTRGLFRIGGIAFCPAAT